MKTERVLAYCPACGEQNAAPEEVMRGGIECVGCGVGFVPEKFTPEPSSAPVPALPEISSVRGPAKTISLLGKFCFFLWLAISGFTIPLQVEQDTFNLVPYIVAGGFFLLGLWLQIIAQLMFIRAALEDS